MEQEPTTLVIGSTGYIIISIVGVGIALALLIVPGLRAIRRDLANARERLANLEGRFQVLYDIGRRPETRERADDG